MRRPLTPRSLRRDARAALASLGQAFRAAPDLWLAGLLGLAAAGSRVFTNRLYATEPSSDEYFYGLYAIEVARTLLGLAEREVADLAGQGRFIGLLVGAAITLIPLDPMHLGRLLQVACNALTVPLAYGLGRGIGLGRQASLAGAGLLLVMPELWETAWRFWPDSQAAFLALATLLAFVRALERPSPALGLLAPALLLATFLTKEYAAASTLPALVVGGVLAAVSRLRARASQRRALALAATTVILVLLALLLALTAGDAVRALFGPTFLAGQVNRTLSALDRVLGGVPVAAQRLPEYLPALRAQLGPREFGSGLTAFWAAGGGALLVAAVRGLARGPSAWARALWLLAMVVWAPAIAYGWMLGVGLVEQSVPGAMLLGLGVLLAAVGEAARGGSIRVATERGEAERALRLPFGLIVLGVFGVAFALFRFSLWAPADLRAAFTPRSFQPAFPAIALLAGWGVASVARALVPASKAQGVIASLVFGVVLAASLVVLSPTRDHLGTQPLLGFKADQEGDLSTPGGLRITALVEAERWLQANLLPSDRVMTSMPRHLAWHARTGVDGYLNAVTIGELGPDLDLRRAKMMALLARPAAVDYVIDFNLYWPWPERAESRHFYAFYRWLQTRSYLEEVYTRHDPNGRVVFFAFRNHRWAESPAYVDREQARLAQLAASGR